MRKNPADEAIEKRKNLTLFGIQVPVFLFLSPKLGIHMWGRWPFSKANHEGLGGK